MIASILIVPIFLVYGYMFRIIKATLAGLDELPEFDEIGEMFVDGLKVFVVAIVYAIPVYIIAAILGLIIGGSTTTTSISMDPTMMWALFFGYLVYIIIAVIIGLIEVIAIANMAYYNGDLGAAFRFSEILDYIARIGWGKYIATYIVIAIVAFIGFFIGIFNIVHSNRHNPPTTDNCTIYSNVRIPCNCIALYRRSSRRPRIKKRISILYFFYFFYSLNGKLLQAYICTIYCISLNTYFNYF